jgi:hypothetical protein
MRGSTILNLSVKLVFPGQCIGAVTFIMSGSGPNDKCEMVFKVNSRHTWCSTLCLGCWGRYHKTYFGHIYVAWSASVFVQASNE